MPHRLPTAIVGGAAAVVAVWALPASTASAQPPAPPADLIQCPTEHGVPADAATPPPAPPGFDENTWAAAFEACAPPPR